MTTGFRTVFLATEPTYAAWLEALEKNWTVAVRNDRWSRDEVLMHGGDEKILDFVRSHEDQWRWWNNPAIRRPMVSLVAVSPRGPFRPHCQKGAHLRVRTAWTNTTQGQLVEPLSQFVSLTVDGVKVDAEEVTKRAGRNRNALSDHYYLWRIPEPTPEEHNATAVVRVLEWGKSYRKTLPLEPNPELHLLSQTFGKSVFSRSNTMSLIDLLRKLGVLRFGAEGCVYHNAKRSASLQTDGVFNSNKDVLDLDKRAGTETTQSTPTTTA